MHKSALFSPMLLALERVRDSDVGPGAGVPISIFGQDEPAPACRLNYAAEILGHACKVSLVGGLDFYGVRIISTVPVTSRTEKALATFLDTTNISRQEKEPPPGAVYRRNQSGLVEYGILLDRPAEIIERHVREELVYGIKYVNDRIYWAYAVATRKMSAKKAILGFRGSFFENPPPCWLRDDWLRHIHFSPDAEAPDVRKIDQRSNPHQHVH